MIELGLSRISQLIKETSITWKAIHIAGTNGKGSVAAYLSRLLYRDHVAVGRFTSPHLIDRWDCITINERTISKRPFLLIENDIKTRNELHNIKASEFELLTATAFEIFSQQGISIGIVECGLGGRLDATNALAPQDVAVSVITKIGLDHQAILGNTLQAIAVEKAGIMKKGVPVVVDGTNTAEVRTLLRQHAMQVGALYYETWPESASMKRAVRGLTLEETQRMLAPHQKSNLILALKTFEIVNESLPPSSFPQFIRPDVVDTSTVTSRPGPSDQRRRSVEPDMPKVIRDTHTNWQGRLQWLSIRPLTNRKPEVLLDGAHNAQSSQALGAFVDQNMRPKFCCGVTWVVAMTKGKDIEQLLGPLIQPNDNLIATRFGPVDGMPWIESEAPEKIEQICKALGTSDANESGHGARFTKAFEDVWSALGKACAVAGKDGPLVITGSLYLVSDVLRLLRDPPSSLSRKDQDEWIVRQKRLLEARRNGIFR